MTKILRFVFISLFSVPLLLGGCSNDPPSVIRIGLITDRSSTAGRQALGAAEIAVDEANREGGLHLAGQAYPLELVVLDTQGSPQGALDAAFQLINQENVSAIVCPTSSQEAIPVSEVAERVDVPMISPTSTHPRTTANKENVFRVPFVDYQQGEILAGFARDDINAATAAVLYDVSNVYSRDLARYFSRFFEQKGGVITAMEEFTPDMEDFTAILQRTAKKDPEVIFLPNYPGLGLRRQVELIRKLQIPSRILGSDSWVVEPLQSNPDFNGTFFCGHWIMNDQNRASRFAEMFNNRFGDEPATSAALTYDAFGLLFAAIRQEQSFAPEAIRQGFYAMDKYAGITGNIEYRNSGDPLRSAYIIRIMDGEYGVYRHVAPRPVDNHQETEGST